MRFDKKEEAIMAKPSMTDGSETCGECGTLLVKTTVADTVPVRYSNDPGSCAGDGSTRLRILTHCPRCQPHPRGNTVMSGTAEEIRRVLS